MGQRLMYYEEVYDVERLSIEGVKEMEV